MTVTEPRTDQREIARLGHEAFERFVRPSLSPGEPWKYVAIEVGTGDFEIAATSQEAVSQVRGRNPIGGDFYIMRTDGTPAFRMKSLR